MDKQIEPCMVEAIRHIEEYILKTTGKELTQEELAQALTKFFVLKEIREFVEMTRAEN